MSPLPVPPSEPIATAEPWSSLFVRIVATLLAVPCTEPALPLKYSLTTDMVRTRGSSRYRPGSDSALRSWRTQTLPRLPVPILWTYLQLSSLHWPRQPFLRSLRDSGGIRQGWDPRPLPQCLKDGVGGPGPPSGLGHQARGSPLDRDLSRHLPQLMRAHHPSFRQPRGLGVPCLPVTRFRGTYIYMPGTSMGRHITMCKN